MSALPKVAVVIARKRPKWERSEKEKAERENRKRKPDRVEILTNEAEWRFMEPGERKGAFTFEMRKDRNAGQVS
jgi:hypothetical protein